MPGELVEQVRDTLRRYGQPLQTLVQKAYSLFVEFLPYNGELYFLWSSSSLISKRLSVLGSAVDWTAEQRAKYGRLASFLRRQPELWLQLGTSVRGKRRSFPILDMASV